MTLAAGSKFGPYKIRSLLGMGGMGEVYRARDARLNRDVAVKILPAVFTNDPERMARFQREAQLLASLNHAHIASIYGLEEKDGIRGLVMEVVEGPTLADRISAGPIPLDEALPIALQVAEALECAHEKGVIHRDLKPANVKLTADGAVKVLDFGLAKALDSSDSNVADPANSPTFASATRMGIVLGTAAYMSPEQAKGKSVDRRTDIWSFGCLLYEMLTGKQAFGGETITDTLAAVVRAEPEWELLPRNTPSALRALLKRCLQKDPKERLRDIGDARIELRQLISASSSSSGIARVSESPGQRRLWLRVLPWGLAVIVFAFALATWLVLNARSAARPPVTRFAITVPHMDEFGEIAISPDGTAIVFDTLPAGGAIGSQFFLRKLDQLSSTAIAGTELSSFPAFSPDGKWLSFAGNGVLKKVRLDSGTAQVICPAPGVVGASWADENTVVFSELDRGLFRVSAGGGTPELVAPIGPQTGKRNYGDVSALPGGKFVLATLASENDLTEASQDIVMVRIDQPGTVPTPKILVQGARFARYAALGMLLFTRGNSLFAVPFDLAQQRITGTPTTVVEKVKVNPDQPLFYFDVSSNGTLVYSPPLGQERVPVIVDRKGQEQALNVSPRLYWDPQISPDGKLLAFAIDSGAQHQNVWVYDLERHTWIRLGFDQRQEMAPVWSQDGRRLFYVTDRHEVFSKLADGSGPEQLLYKFKNFLFLACITPDGRTLVGEQAHENLNWDVVALHLKDDNSHVEGDMTPLISTPAVEWRPQLSRDGHWLAYVSDESGNSEVYVRAYPGPGGKWQVSTDGGDEPRWSGTGRELFYMHGDAMMAVGVKTSPTFTPAVARVLFKGKYERPGGVMNYAVTPDGEKFIMLKKQAESSPPEVDVVMNWVAQLQK